MNRADRRLFATILAGALVACVTDHAPLEKKLDTGGGGTSDSDGSAGGSGKFTQIGAGTAGSVASAVHSDDEAPGDNVLSIVHGVVDAPSVVFCFSKIASDGSAMPFGQPLTSAPLTYGASAVLHSVAGADLANDVLQPWLIAGDLDLVAGLDCADAISRAQAEEGVNAGADAGAAAQAAEAGAGGAPPVALPSPVLSFAAGAGGEAGAAGVPEVQPLLRARGLPAIPAGTLNGGRSYLLVANGCMGGAGFNAPKSDTYCGAGYEEHAPTVSAVLVALSRKAAPSAAGLQIVHASLATSTINVYSRPPLLALGTSITIATNVAPGQLAPRPAFLENSTTDFGTARQYRIEVTDQGKSLLSENWTDVLAHGGLQTLDDGTTYAIVLLGPRSDLLGDTRFWNAPELTILLADPK